ncbi:hypothetical protein Oweho_3127 [Owenweeksia hongkongensis DSM 17368]|uniref:KWG repeat protein n=1 Tax=Owenweeksia hongkongensis (strain DSM 17368 / CIP 108786 / JCM 12287 / NRRL B-23963 / UST20020801) TaxID=926562 RepID=G8R355_OWEHD|nr:WG repeat-containing protein [Owenweeksia hongkongensis]AEV34080.1 hypothetical protein Oweho_3127 [Owenweeksia hongkongensis DSM 17368]
MTKLFFLVFSFFWVSVYAQGDKHEEFRRVFSNSKWGFLDGNGDTIIPFGKYKFLNPIDDYGMILAHLHTGKEGYIDIEQNVLIPFLYDDLGVFSMNLAPAKIGGKFGYVNRKGELVIDLKYQKAGYFKAPGIAIARYESGYGLIDTLENIILNFEYHDIAVFQNHNVAVVEKGNKFGFFFLNENRLSPVVFDKIYKSQIERPLEVCLNCAKKVPFNKGVALVEKDNDYALINEQFEEVVPFGLYDSIQPINMGGLAIVKKKAKYGLVNFLGEEILKPEYEFISTESARSYEDDFTSFRVINNGSTTLLDANGVNALGQSFDSVAVLSSCMYMAYGKGNPLILDNDLNILFDKYECYHQVDNGFIVKKNGKMGHVSEEGIFIIPLSYDSLFQPRLEKLYYAGNNGKYGVLDLSGEVIIPFEYGLITRTWYNDQEENLIVEKSGKIGTITMANEIAIPFEYDGLSGWVEYSPEEHYAKKDGKYGMVKPNGEVLIPCVYDYIHYYTSSAILVKKDDLYGVLDRGGNLIIPIKYHRIILDLDFWGFKESEDEKFVVLHKNQWSYFDLNGRVAQKDVSRKVIEAEYAYELLHDPSDYEMDWMLMMAK